MTESNDNLLEDLEATNADEVTGGGKPLLEVQVGGQNVTADIDENRSGGYDVTAGGAGASVGEDRHGRRTASAGGADVAAGTSGAEAGAAGQSAGININP